MHLGLPAETRMIKKSCMLPCANDYKILKKIGGVFQKPGKWIGIAKTKCIGVHCAYKVKMS